MENKFIYKIIENKQYYRTTKTERFAIGSPDRVAQFIKQEIGNCDREKLLVLGLNNSYEVIYTEVAHVGSYSYSVLDPKPIFKSALLNNAIAIIIAHNHPSGKLEFSSEDVEITKRIDQAGKIIGISLIDHIIVTDENYVSAKELDIF